VLIHYPRFYPNDFINNKQKSQENKYKLVKICKVLVELVHGVGIPHEELQSLQYLFSQHLLGHKPENLSKLAVIAEDSS